jgi:hypothetical protein
MQQPELMRRRIGGRIIRAGLLVLSLAAAGLARAGQVQWEAHRYVEQVGEIRKAVHWCSVKTAIHRLIYRSDGELYVTEMDAGLATKSWWLQAVDQDTRLTAVRRENEIFIEGARKGVRSKNA